MGAPRIGSQAVRVQGIVPDKDVFSTPLDPYLTLKALSGYSGISVRQLRIFLDLPADRALPCYRVGPRILLVRRGDFDAWIAAYECRGRRSLTEISKAFRTQ